MEPEGSLLNSKAVWLTAKSSYARLRTKMEDYSLVTARDCLVTSLDFASFFRNSRIRHVVVYLRTLAVVGRVCEQSVEC
jgi:hypothetical protein